MKETIQISGILLLAFLLPLLTSWLLDWSWIDQNWTRKALVMLLMLIEIAISVLILKGMLKRIGN
jgi:hypothetical protein